MYLNRQHFKAKANTICVLGLGKLRVGIQGALQKLPYSKLAGCYTGSIETPLVLAARVEPDCTDSVVLGAANQKSTHPEPPKPLN